MRAKVLPDEFAGAEVPRMSIGDVTIESDPESNWSGLPSGRPNRISISVVIPTLNEAANLPHVLTRLPDIVDEVVLVDGHSIDDTIAVARPMRPDVRVVLQDGRGKGNALACGFAAATGDIIVMLDADGSTDPAEIPRFVDALLAGSDFAKGSRFAAGGDSNDITRAPRGSATACSACSSTCSSAPATRTSATATTRSGAIACRT